MVVLIRPPTAVGPEAARIVIDAVRRKPDLCLGLATGRTTQDLYAALVRLSQQDGADWTNVCIFSLDDYVDLPIAHPQRFSAVLRREFLDRIAIRPAQVHVLDLSGQDDLTELCAAYEQRIHDAGGIDLQILGIGRNGHIGFNEPGSSLGSRTRPVLLADETREDNSAFFESPDLVPRWAVTMGIGTILAAKRILLLATGPAKAEAVARALEGPITASLPASALQLHPSVTVVLDEAAGAALLRKGYYAQAALGPIPSPTGH
ncbi:glucosamine-6-phosphate deaminase [Candidatus Nitrospira bockiana]